MFCCDRPVGGRLVNPLGRVATAGCLFFLASPDWPREDQVASPYTLLTNSLYAFTLS